MALNKITKTGIETGQTIEALQVSQSFAAFNPASTDGFEIEISGSLAVSGSTTFHLATAADNVTIKNIRTVPSASALLKAVVADTDTGTLYFDASIGAQGITGTQGTQGVQGVTGPQGINGPQGTTGTKGDEGPNGPSGNVGTQGTTGTQGIQGITGAQGISGEKGQKGEVGTQGETGTQGITGIQGTQGIQGITGPQGI